MENKQTLQQGLIEFHQKNGKYFSKKSYSEKGKEFLTCHDIAHVVFGCDTTLYGEGLVKIWTTFGTTLNFWEVTKGYHQVDAFTLFKGYSFRHFLKNIISLLITIPKAILRARRMKKPWPFKSYENYLNTPIEDIRREYNIEVIL